MVKVSQDSAGAIWAIKRTENPITVNVAVREIEPLAALRHTMGNSHNRAIDPTRRDEAPKMNILPVVAICTATLIFAAPTAAFAGPGSIDQACRQAARSAASPKLCRCIQKVANKSLTRGERYKVSKWFFDPHKAQQTRQSDRRKDEVLWKRYKAFGERAQKICG